LVQTAHLTQRRDRELAIPYCVIRLCSADGNRIGDCIEMNNHEIKALVEMEGRLHFTYDQNRILRRNDFSMHIADREIILAAIEAIKPLAEGTHVMVEKIAGDKDHIAAVLIDRTQKDIIAWQARAEAAEAREQEWKSEIERRDEIIASSEFLRKAAETRVTELEAALKPFAETSKCFDTMPVKDPEQWFAYSGTQHANYTVGAITVGDLRRAAKALAPTGKE
jgi:hypothetical protein